MTDQKQFRVRYGCIRSDDSIMSRDFAPTEFFDTPEQVHAFLRETSQIYARSDHKLWAVNICKLVEGEYRKVNKANEPVIYIPEVKSE